MVTVHFNHVTKGVPQVVTTVKMQWQNLVAQLGKSVCSFQMLHSSVFTLWVTNDMSLVFPTATKFSS